MKTIRAVYSQGVFRPTEHVDLPEPCVVEFEPRPVAEGDGKEVRPSTPSIEDELAAIWADVPVSEWAKLPKDLTDNLDHYIYGTPKK